MGGFSLVHWLVLAIVAVLLLGGGRFSNLMGDVAKGIKQFKKGMAEEDEDKREPSRLEGRRAPDARYDRDERYDRDDRERDREARYEPAPDPKYDREADRRREDPHP